MGTYASLKGGEALLALNDRHGNVEPIENEPVQH